MKVWILTEEHNDYDQYGEYFVAVFAEKPSLKQIERYVDCCYCTPEHVWHGGGRTGHLEDVWWNLREESCQ